MCCSTRTASRPSSCLDSMFSSKLNVSQSNQPWFFIIRNTPFTTPSVVRRCLIVRNIKMTNQFPNRVRFLIGGHRFEDQQSAFVHWIHRKNICLDFSKIRNLIIYHHLQKPGI
ncbi:hypothetical protein HanIR_Chr02g0073301 [Helianthus annuus]|nr:hypothetical protein HanIR_Chr02g0073301 [Helianthus annuus]